MSHKLVIRETSQYRVHASLTTKGGFILIGGYVAFFGFMLILAIGVGLFYGTLYLGLNGKESVEIDPLPPED